MSSRGRGRGGAGRGNNRNYQSASAQNGLSSGNVWAQRSQKPAGQPPGDQSHQSVQKNEVERPTQQPSRYQDACAKIQDSVKQYIKRHGLEFSKDSDDEDEDTSALDRSAILDTLLQQFDDGGRGDGVNDDHLGRTKQYLEDCLRGGDKIVCLICIESIRKTDEIWSCLSCYSGFHLSCIQKWAKDSVFMLGEALEGADKSKIKWCCPKCRKEYEQNQTPRHYLCWCGKQRDPPDDPWLVPHSCGQACKRALEPACGHNCNLLCHPGPCPPCPQVVRAKCYCGKSDAVPRRCSHKLWSCAGTCGKKLECGFHPCKAICHVGDCPPCPEKSLQTCACGRSKAVLRPCNDRIWHCDTPCGNRLSCGHHECDKVCHAKSECGDCPLTGPRTCPCGKVKRVLPCTEDIGPCGDTCGKLLSCGTHVCSSRCHRGNCGGCLQLSTKRCRCGAKEKEVTCQKEYLCENKCKRTRDCKRHACNRKCCTGDCPSCEQPCARTLGCKNHKCTSRCHAGPCYPCNATVDIKCFCGKTTRTVPCGRERNAKPPKCSLQCKLPPNCHHANRQPHKCHFGQCPPCNLRCTLPLNGCSHCCEATCHDAVARKKAGKKAATPWEIVTPEIEIVKLPCPPCQAPIPVECFGKHEVSNLPCSESNIYSCSKPCGRLLTCTNHTCSLPCHVVVAPKSAETVSNGDAHGPELAGPNCETCGRPCEKPRPAGCSHRCPMELKGTGCHRGSCPRCDKSVKLACHCGVNGVFVKCCKWTRADREERETLQSCQNACPKTMLCGHSCTLVCHVGPCADLKTCKKKVQVRCGCKRKKKEFQCTFLRENASNLAQLVPCDEDCAKRAEEKEKEAEKRKKEEEEQHLKKEQEELEAFERKMKGAGKKRKQRIEVEEEQNDPWWKSTKGVAVAVTSVCCVLVGIAVSWML